MDIVFEGMKEVGVSCCLSRLFRLKSLVRNVCNWSKLEEYIFKGLSFYVWGGGERKLLLLLNVLL